MRFSLPQMFFCHYFCLLRSYPWQLKHMGNNELVIAHTCHESPGDSGKWQASLELKQMVTTNSSEQKLPEGFPCWAAISDIPFLNPFLLLKVGLTCLVTAVSPNPSFPADLGGGYVGSSKINPSVILRRRTCVQGFTWIVSCIPYSTPRR